MPGSMVGMPLRWRSKRSPASVTTAPHLPVPLGLLCRKGKSRRLTRACCTSLRPKISPRLFSWTEIQYGNVPKRPLCVRSSRTCGTMRVSFTVKTRPMSAKCR